MKEPRIVDAALLDALTESARESPRLRRHLNFHASEAEPCNRYLNAIEPASYIAPHRHLEPTKDETIFVVRGRLGLVFFDEDGEVTGRALLVPGGAQLGVHVPHGRYHSVLALEPGTVMLGTKAGPYVPLTADERAPWAPAEGDPAVPAYLGTLRALFEPA